MEVRQARADELPMLKQRLIESGGEVVDLDTARCWVAVEGGQIVGMLSARMTWQLEPMLIFPECRRKNTRRRACFELFAAVCNWLGDPLQNKSGIRWFFFVTRSRAVMAWTKHKHLGLHRQYKGAATYLKHL